VECFKTVNILRDKDRKCRDLSEAKLRLMKGTRAGILQKRFFQVMRNNSKDL
jgi:hypothetical protein